MSAYHWVQRWCHGAKLDYAREGTKAPNTCAAKSIFEYDGTMFSLSSKLVTISWA